MIRQHCDRSCLNRIVCSAICALTFVSSVSSFSFADQILVSELSDKSVRVGGVECSARPERPVSAIDLLTGQSNGEMTAGELWKFFNAQGVKSMDQLTLCVDCDPADLSEATELSAIDISTFELKIQDPVNKDVLLTNVNFGNDTLILGGPATDPTRPEARLAVNLGYDFMERFSADSREKVSMNIASKSSAAFLPRISIESSETMLSNSNMLTLLGFVSFWAVVFTVVNHVTKPDAAAL